MNILFIGTVQFSKKALELLIDMDAAPCGVVTRARSDFNTDHAALAPVCRAQGIPCLEIDKTDDDTAMEWMVNQSPDVVFCFGWSSLLPEPVIRMARMGVVGFHPAALPMNRGRHPLIWALALGLDETASTFFFIDEGVDSGDILSQKTVAIGDDDDASVLYEKVTRTALTQIREFVPALQNGTYTRIPQDHNLANTWRKRGRADGRIDFRMGSRSIHNLVRALARPYAGAHVEYQGHDIKVWRAREVDAGSVNIEPGRILSADSRGICVKCGDKAVSLVEHEFETLPGKGEYL